LVRLILPPFSLLTWIYLCQDLQNTTEDYYHCLKPHKDIPEVWRTPRKALERDQGAELYSLHKHLKMLCCRDTSNCPESVWFEQCVQTQANLAQIEHCEVDLQHSIGLRQLSYTQ
jgi:hypothetical protein